MRDSRPAPHLLFLVAIVAALAVAPPATSYWDAYGYLAQAIRGDVGGLAFGRPVFVMAAHAIASAWLDAGGSPWLIEPVLRLAVLLASAAATPLTWRLARACGLDSATAGLAALSVACSPAMAHTSTQVLTDGPALTCVLVACVWGVGIARGATRAVRVRAAILSGAALGVAIGVREQSAIAGATLLLFAFGAPAGERRRLAVLLSAACALVVALPMAWLIAARPGYLATVAAWLEGVRADRAAKTFAPGDLAIYAAWLLSLGPAAIVAAARAWTRRGTALTKPASVLFAIAVPALAQLLWVGTLRGVGYSPRFLIASLPAAVAIPGAIVLRPWLTRSTTWRVAIVLAIVLPVVVAAPILQRRQRDVAETLRVWPSMVLAVPSGGVIVSGQPCAAVPFIEAAAARDRRRPAPPPSWDAVCPGWGWPADLDARLDAALAQGRTVAIDLRPLAWLGAEQHAAETEAALYAISRTARGDRARIIVWR